MLWLLTYTTILFLADHGGTSAQPTVPCDKSLIDGFNENTMVYEAGRLSCMTPLREYISFTDGTGRDQATDDLTCDSTNPEWWWPAESKWTGIANTARLWVQCVQRSCEKRLLNSGIDGDGISQYGNGYGKPVKYWCADDKKAFAHPSGKVFSKILCRRGHYWTTEDEEPIEKATEPLDVQCAPGGQGGEFNTCSGLRKLPEWNKELMLSDKNELMCKDGQDLIYHGQHFASLSCTRPSGWSDGGKPLDPPANDHTWIVVKCGGLRTTSTTPPTTTSTTTSAAPTTSPATAPPTEPSTSTTTTPPTTPPTTPSTTPPTTPSTAPPTEPSTSTTTTPPTTPPTTLPTPTSDAPMTSPTIDPKVTAVACDKSLISDWETVIWEVSTYNSVEYTFMACFGAKEMLIDGQFYKALQCAEFEGWTYYKNSVKSPTAKFAANCVEKACHPTLAKISGASPLPIMEPGSGSFRCEGEKRELRVGKSSSTAKEEEARIFGRILTCDKKAGWKFGSVSIADAIKEVTVECVALTCDKSLLKFMNKENNPWFNDEGDSAVLHCKDDESLLIEGSFFPSMIVCQKQGFWTDNSKLKTFAPAGLEFTAECVVKACHKELISNSSGMSITTQREDTMFTKSLTCADEKNELRILIKNDYYYSKKFMCNSVFGWMGAFGMGPEDEVDLECVPKSCDESLIASTNASVTKYHLDGNSLTCGNSEISLVFNHTRYDEIVCFKEDYWISGKDTKRLAKATEVIVVDCIPKACDSRLISTDPNVMLEGEPLTLNCSKKGLDLHIAGTATYHAQLSCDTTRGWLDGDTSIWKSWEPIAVECVPGNCNVDLIKFAHEKVKILPSNADSRYTHAACVNENERLFANGNFRKSLECDESSLGWKDGTTQIGKLPRDKITIECKLPNCDAVFIKNGKSKITYNFPDLESLRDQFYPTSNSMSDLTSNETEVLKMEQLNRRELRCPDRTHFLRFNGVIQMETVECSIEDNQWLGIGAAADRDVQVDCIQICQWSIPKSSKSKMEKSDIVHHMTGPETLNYFCKPKDVPRMLILNGEKHTSLQCSLRGGWANEVGVQIKDEKGEVFPVDTEIELRCEDYCTKFTEKPDDFVVKIGIDRLEVQCKNQSFAIRTINAPGNHIVPELSCTYSGGWHGPPGTPQVYPDTQRQLQFECYKVCTNTPSTILQENHDTNGTKSIKCLEGKTLYVNDRPSRPLTCNARDGWRDAEDPVIHYSSLDTLRSTCREAKFCKRKPVVLHTLQIEPEQEGPGTFSCINTNIGAANKGIKLNGAFVHSRLKCDIFRGWLDFKGKQVAKPEDVVDLQCDTVKCTTSSNSLKCADYNNKFPEIFSNYVCMAHNFDNDTDPNLRVCGAKQKLLTAKGVLVNKGLRCTDDGSWHTIGDEKKVRTADNGTAAFCVQKRCTVCSKPTEIQSANYYTEVPIYDEGSADTCAKATCPSGLWLVAKDKKHDEYVGASVVCSAVNESKWELKNGSFVDNIACVSRFETCDAFALNTACDFTFANCTEISHDHNKNNFCPGDTMMYYKNRSELTFKDENNKRRNQPKLALRCDGRVGWTVKMGKFVVDTIGQGGQVICAEQNPLPVIKVTTTKAPILIACKACPTPIQARLECPDCSQQGPDIALETSSEADKCYAKSVTGGGIISEKLGHIEGKLECQLNNPVWKHEGTEVGKFAASVKAKDADNSQAQMQSSTTFILILFATFSSMIGIFY